MEDGMLLNTLYPCWVSSETVQSNKRQQTKFEIVSLNIYHVIYINSLGIEFRGAAIANAYLP